MKSHKPPQTTQAVKKNEVVPANHEHMPNFLIVGAAKSGTTSLYHYLEQHPDIYMPWLKEPAFFAAADGSRIETNGLQGWHPNTNRVNHLADYQNLFKDAESEKARGEASAVYLYLSETAARISTYIPEAKILAILRHPADRAYSAYLHHVREGLENLDFSTALAEESQRIIDGWTPLYHYREMGYYYEQLSRYYNTFGSENVHVYLYDDMRNNPLEVVRSIFEVLGVDKTFAPDFATKHNISGVPKNRLLHNIHYFLKGSNQSVVKSIGKRVIPTSLRMKLKITTIQKLQEVNLVKPTLSSAVRSELLEGYRDDIVKLQSLINRDLSSWLKAS